MSAPVAVKVTERFEGTRRILDAEGWEWVTCEEFGDDEPRISDEALAPRMGLPVKDLRTLAQRHIAAGNITPFSNTRTVRRFTTEGKNRGSVSVTELMFTEADALFLVSRGEKGEAIALTKGMIQIVIAVRRHLANTVAVRAHERKPPTAKAAPLPEPPKQLPAPKALPEPRPGQPLPERISTAIELPRETWNVLRAMGGPREHPSKTAERIVRYHCGLALSTSMELAERVGALG